MDKTDSALKSSLLSSKNTETVNQQTTEVNAENTTNSTQKLSIASDDNKSNASQISTNKTTVSKGRRGRSSSRRYSRNPIRRLTSRGRRSGSQTRSRSKSSLTSKQQSSSENPSSGLGDAEPVESSILFCRGFLIFLIFIIVVIVGGTILYSSLYLKRMRVDRRLYVKLNGRIVLFVALTILCMSIVPLLQFIFYLVGMIAPYSAIGRQIKKELGALSKEYVGESEVKSSEHIVKPVIEEKPSELSKISKEEPRETEIETKPTEVKSIEKITEIPPVPPSIKEVPQVTSSTTEKDPQFKLADDIQSTRESYIDLDLPSIASKDGIGYNPLEESMLIHERETNVLDMSFIPDNLDEYDPIIPNVRQALNPPRYF